MAKLKPSMEHKILNRPLIAFILLFLWAELIFAVGSAFDLAVKQKVADYPIEGIFTIIAAMLILLIHKKWLRPGFKGCLRLKNIIRGIAYAAPFTLAVIAVNLLSVFGEGKEIMTGLYPLLIAAAAGLSEEVIFRGLPISNAMRTGCSDRKVIFILIFSSFTFGSMHMANILYGADITYSIFQSLFGISQGLMWGAVYLRTGTLLPGIIAHILIDYTAFMDKSVYMSQGAITSNMASGAEYAFIICFFIILMIVGFVLIRPSVWGKIRETWKEIVITPSEIHEMETAAGITDKDRHAAELGRIRKWQWAAIGCFVFSLIVKLWVFVTIAVRYGLKSERFKIRLPIFETEAFEILLPLLVTGGMIMIIMAFKKRSVRRKLDTDEKKALREAAQC